MPKTGSTSKSNAAAVTRLPDFVSARLLIGSPWLAVEAQAGKLSHRSKRFPSGWSASLLFRGVDDVLVHSESYDCGGQEQFCLRFRRSVDKWSSTHLKLARPAFAPIVQWPPELEFATEFLKFGAVTAEVGLGPPIGTTHRQSIVPIHWCCFRAGGVGLLLFADSEIPLNIGVAAASAGAAIRRSFPTGLIVTI